MSRVLVLVIAGLLTIYCVVEVAQAEPFAVRRMPRWLWATVIIVFPVVGAIAWLLWGRPNKQSSKSEGGRPMSPDDDSDFLRGL